MRLWSLHPHYLDAKGLVACWREGLLARKVLLGQTVGYRSHPQLERFRAQPFPIVAIDAYLAALRDEAVVRGYRFDRSKIEFHEIPCTKIPVTEGQLRLERDRLLGKLASRDPERYAMLAKTELPATHSLFECVAGDAENWEKS